MKASQVNSALKYIIVAERASVCVEKNMRQSMANIAQSAIANTCAMRARVSDDVFIIECLFGSISAVVAL